MKVKIQLSTKFSRLIKKTYYKGMLKKKNFKNIELKKWETPQVIFLSTPMTLGGSGSSDDFSDGLRSG